MRSFWRKYVRVCGFERHIVAHLENMGIIQTVSK
jgi:hypothetical protein